jgi:hypothetical protein
MNPADGIEARIYSRVFPGLPVGKAVIPDYSGYCIAAVPGLIQSLFGRGGAGGEFLEQVLVDVCPKRVDRVVFLILDGVGYVQLRELLARFPDLYLHRLIEQGRLLPLTSVFPPTTVSALTSFSTGRTPQEHKMVGYRLYLEEIDTVTNMVRMATLEDPKRDSAIKVGLDLKKLLDLPTVYEQLAALGVETHVLLNRGIAGSGLSQLLYRGAARIHPTVDFTDMLVAARRILRSAQGEVFLTLYWSGTDTIAHTYGPFTEEFAAELRSVDGALEREWGNELGGTLLILSSDHGFVGMEKEDYYQLSEGVSRRHLVRLPVGEPRASYLFVREGQMRAMAEFATERFGDGLVCLDAGEALAMGLFGRGEMSSEVERRIGDLLLVSTDRTGLFHPYPEALMLKGMHGGLTPHEMLVPLIVTRL